MELRLGVGLKNNNDRGKNSTYIDMCNNMCIYSIYMCIIFTTNAVPPIAGIIKGDEIMVINGAIVSDLDMMYLESVLQEEQSLSMMMR